MNTIRDQYNEAVRRVSAYSRKDLQESIKRQPLIHKAIPLNQKTEIIRAAYLQSLKNVFEAQIEQLEQAAMPKAQPKELPKAEPKVQYPQFDLNELPKELPDYEVRKHQNNISVFIRNPMITSVSLLRELVGDVHNYRYAIRADGRWVFPQENKIYTHKAAKNFIFGVMKKFYHITQVNLQIFPLRGKPNDFLLGESTDINCVLKSIVQLRPTSNLVIQKLHDVIGSSKVNKETADMISKKARVRLIFKSQLDNTWYDTDPKDSKKYPKLTLFAHDSHCTPYKKPNYKVTNVSYVDNIQDAYKQTHGFRRIYTTEDSYNGEHMSTTVAFIHDGTMYKTYKPPAPYDTDPDYFKCTNDLAFRYTKFVKDNRLRAAYQPYYDLFKEANHYLTTQQFSDYNLNDKLHYYDMNRAYPSFKQSPLYEKYQFPVGNFNLFKCEPNDYYLLDNTGFAIIDNVVYNNDLINTTKWIQPGIYTTMRLKYILSRNLATFTMTHFIIADKEKLQFPFTNDKLQNNALIGRMITHGKSKLQSYKYNTSEDYELEQLIYEAESTGKNVGHVDYERRELTITEESSSNNALWHIHAYILDYQQITFMHTMLQAQNDLVMFIVDGFFTRKEINIPLSNKPHGFKYDYIAPKNQSTYLANTSNGLATNHSLLEAPSISVYENRLNGFTYTYGPAGSGKSRDFFISRLISSKMGTPTHLLKYNHRLKVNGDAKQYIDTFHKIFGVNVAHHTPIKCENFIIDEFTMLSTELLLIAINYCKKHRVNLYLIGDFDPKLGIMQLEPSEGTPINNEFMRQFIAVNKGTTSLDNRRQNAQQCMLLDSLRGMSYDEQLVTLYKWYKEQYGNLGTTLDLRDKLPVSPVSPNFVLFSNAVNSYDVNSIGISYTNSRCNEFNTSVRDRTINKLAIKARVLKNGKVSSKDGKGDKIELTKGMIKFVDKEDNSKVWFDRMKSTDKTPNGYLYEAAYMATCDAVQGGTFSETIYVDLHRANQRKNLLYTAVTRATDLKNIRFILDEHSCKLLDIKV